VKSKWSAREKQVKSKWKASKVQRKSKGSAREAHESRWYAIGEQAKNRQGARTALSEIQNFIPLGGLPPPMVLRDDGGAGVTTKIYESIAHISTSITNMHPRE
jgi:hypothetical protein